MWIYAAGIVLIIILVYLLAQGVRCHSGVGKSHERLAFYGAETISLSYGNMTYVDKGDGETVLSMHGIFGGYDQAYDICKDFSFNCRIIAPSRFGYVGSDVSGEGTPAEQAKAYVELLDKLGIDKIYVLGASAGGTVTIRFALDYPGRIKGLILYSSAMPYIVKPEVYSAYQGPPAFMLNNYMMYLFSPLFGPVYGMSSSTIYGMLPVGDRKEGVILDASISNPDMAKILMIIK